MHAHEAPRAFFVSERVLTKSVYLHLLSDSASPKVRITFLLEVDQMLEDERKKAKEDAKNFLSDLSLG